MSDIAARIATIQREHTRARQLAGVTGRTSTRKLATGTPSRFDVERIESAERDRDARRMTEQARHTEAARLARRMRTVHDAWLDATNDGDVERAARLGLLYGDIESARDRYVHGTFQTPARVEDWAPGGRFTRYARRYDLGFIGYTSDDIAQDAAEILAAAGLFTPAGDLAGHSIGDAYRALKHAYRRGLGFYGYQRRGKVVERDTTEQGYTVHESESVEYIRERARADAAIVARATRFPEAFDDEAIGEDEARLARLAEARQRGMQTLARRFPLNADGRMLALATLLTEGYTVEELCEGLGVQERTLHDWAATLGQVAGVRSAERDHVDTRDAFQVIDDIIDAA